MSATLAEMRPSKPAVVTRRRWSGIIFVIVFHVLGIYALASGLANSTVQLLKGNMETVDVAVEQVDDKPPPPPPPDFKPPPPQVVMPDIVVDLATAPPATNTIQTNVKPAAPPAEATPPKPDRGRNQATEADYPPISRRLNEEGTTLLKLTITTEGRAQDVSVSKSSGFPRLDEAAVTIATNRFRWSPAKDPSGTAIAVGRLISVKWQLR